MSQGEVDGHYKQLILHGYLRIKGGEYPVVELTALGKQAIAHREVISLDVAETKKVRRKRAVEDAHLSDDDRALFEDLRTWRTETARALGVPPYVVLSDRTLTAIASERPQTVADLLGVKGIGPVKADVYSEAIIERVRKG